VRVYSRLGPAIRAKTGHQTLSRPRRNVAVPRSLTARLSSGATTAATGTGLSKPACPNAQARTARRTRRSAAAHASPGERDCRTPPSPHCVHATPAPGARARPRPLLGRGGPIPQWRFHRPDHNELHVERFVSQFRLKRASATTVARHPLLSREGEAGRVSLRMGGDSRSAPSVRASQCSRLAEPECRSRLDQPTWKRCGSGKPQQSAAAVGCPSLVEQTERQAAVDRSRCSRLLSSGSQVRVLPGASPGGRFGSGISAPAAPSRLLPGCAVEASWKREGPGGELFRHFEASLRVRVPKAVVVPRLSWSTSRIRSGMALLRDGEPSPRCCRAASRRLRFLT
jgi:hypothetical protein